jgi:hypothetical protein
MIRMIVFAFLVTVNVAWAAAPPGQPDGARIPVWIAQLGDEDFAVREAASRRLAGVGISALPLLRMAAETADLETRIRVRRLIERIQREAALAPRRVNATFRDAPLEDVLNTIRWQTDLPVEAFGDEAATRRFTGSFDNATFWEVVDMIATAYRLRVTMEKRQNGYRVVLRPGPVQRFVSRSGTFRIALLSLHQEQDRELDRLADHPPPEVTLMAQVLTEPRYEVDVMQRASLKVATDERGRTYPSAKPLPQEQEQADVRLALFTGREEALLVDSVKLRFERPNAEARRVSRMTGTVPVHLLIGRKWTLLAKASATPQEKAVLGATYTVTETERKTNASMMWISINRSRFAHVKFDFRDEEGRSCPTEDSGAGAGTGYYQRGWRVSPSASGKLATQVWINHPIQHEVDIPFDFRDVPLP